MRSLGGIPWIESRDVWWRERCGGTDSVGHVGEEEGGQLRSVVDPAGLE